MNTNLKDNIQGYSSFVYYREDALWYRTATDLMFPVPVSDIGTAQFLATEKSLLLMRWIRKYLDSLKG
jgi:hypothetical protein